MLLQSHDMPQHDNQSVGPISVSGFGIGDNLDLIIMPLLSSDIAILTASRQVITVLDYSPAYHIITIYRWRIRYEIKTNKHKLTVKFYCLPRRIIIYYNLCELPLCSDTICNTMHCSKPLQCNAMAGSFEENLKSQSSMFTCSVAD